MKTKILIIVNKVPERIKGKISQGFYEVEIDEENNIIFSNGEVLFKEEEDEFFKFID